ncbi:MAG: hypothetical protein ACPLSA_05960, partial [Caldanaerobacter sp.]
MAELADAPDLGSGGISRGGSSPFARTILQFAIEIGHKMVTFCLQTEDCQQGSFLFLQKLRFIVLEVVIKFASDLKI